MTSPDPGAANRIPKSPAVVLVDPGLAQRLEALFERDMRECTELDLAVWTRRSTGHKLLDRAFYLLKEQL
ncbi:hypothetical protein [Azohydromonas australica]|uniref:hypothetical protein n=1 Tax=Azohydromonas australica TaxID=364039 RepID=UPI00146AD647|nr:hypothetical protein [Azohydromonas australica]